jgi:hypothetical protein
LEPFTGGEENAWLVVLQEITYHLRALSHEKPFATTVFLLFQLTDKFELVFTDHFPKSR